MYATSGFKAPSILTFVLQHIDQDHAPTSLKFQAPRQTLHLKVVGVPSSLRSLSCLLWSVTATRLAWNSAIQTSVAVAFEVGTDYLFVFKSSGALQGLRLEG